MNPPRWHLLTGEYPPRPGGVGDYSALVAAGLAAAGAEVHVWTNRSPGVEPGDEPGLTVHRTMAGWSGADLDRLGSELDVFPSPRLLVVQYAPNAWGRRGLNLRFCRWLVGRRDRGDEVRVMFHEVWYPLRLRDHPRRWLLALGQRRMARDLMRASSRDYVSIPAWEPLLRGLGRDGAKPIVWLPVPSNIAVAASADDVASVRRRIAPGGRMVIGSFGTFGGAIGAMLAEIMPALLGDRDDRIGLLIGRGGEAFADRLRAADPGLSGRLIATGRLPSAGVSAHLGACDLLVQPYPDGVTSRRGSVMAGLAHGVATVSNSGALSEPIWVRSGCLALAPGPEPGALVRESEPLLADPEARARLGEAGRSTYRQFFAIERTIEAMLGVPIPDEVTAPCRDT